MKFLEVEGSVVKDLNYTRFKKISKTQELMALLKSTNRYRVISHMFFVSPSHQSTRTSDIKAKLVYYLIKNVAR